MENLKDIVLEHVHILTYLEQLESVLFSKVGLLKALIHTGLFFRLV